AVVRKPPYCQGTIHLPVDDYTLFYGKDAMARRLDFSNASPEELQHLAETCDPATFGLGGEDVYDETYRKAGKLDASDFMLRFTPETVGLLDVIRAELLVEGRSSAKSIRAELYKLNVYGPEAFFKPHVDTPRSELMFGSLVVVFPTAHEGGALKLRERDARNVQEWTFDSAALLAQAVQPSIAYVAFYSDVEHEVMPVQSGHRVTVTYNLYYAEDTTPLPAAQPVPTNEHTFRSKVQALLDDPTFLPEGGNLMFLLRHQYPMATTPKGRTEARKALKDVAAHLKVTDALVLKVMGDLSLDASLKIVYQDTTAYK
ncbi:uncharacterized protein TRAVEDRAFT_96340, partial [Trametes versicolor FP-101664 SS1]|uniref:uncharacterized protein n=1 Tax=Trametes versicolor (strain FP-101664) TaxID=717944 RepID=UPI00046221DA